MEEHLIPNQKTISLGKRLIMQYLLKKKYIILEKNFKSAHCIIDIIATNNIRDKIIFIKTKVRKDLNQENTKFKIEDYEKDKIRECMKKYMEKKGLINIKYTFDEIEIFICRNRYKIIYKNEVLKFK